MAPVVSRRPWEAGEEHKEREQMEGGREGVGASRVVGCGAGGWRVRVREGAGLLGVHMP